MLEDWQISHFFLCPYLMFRIHFFFGWFFNNLLLLLGLILLADFGLDFSIGLGHLFLICIASNSSRVEDTALIGILNDLSFFFLADDEIPQRHHGIIVKHVYVPLI